MTFHLNVRVAWHDSQWNGRVCRAPSANAFCVELDRIRELRNDSQDELAGRWFRDLSPSQLPPCQTEAGAFMNEHEWWRVVEHPYADSKRAAATHGMLRPTRITVPEFSTFAIPFFWMLRENQESLQEELPDKLPPDVKPPFDSSWVFTRERQEAISTLFFNRLEAGSSLVTFYTKSGQPIDESISRLVVGIGTITKIYPIQFYDSTTAQTYPLWDRLFSHSIRRDQSDGFLLPYHDYLQSAGDPNEDERRHQLLLEIAVVPERAHHKSFSFAGELANSDVALSTLVRSLDALRKVRQHGIAKGPWMEREDWINAQISRAWIDRGAFPGAGSALEALGMRLGTALLLDLMATGRVSSLDDPWTQLDGILRGQASPPRREYQADIDAVRSTWSSLPEERRSLLKLLSRFSLSPEQAKRWFDRNERNKATRGTVSDADIIANPYRIAETDLGDAYEHPVSLGTVDRGTLPDSTISARHPIPSPSGVRSSMDVRRGRAALVGVLRTAADQGDTLLSEDELFTALKKLDLAQPLVLTKDWLGGNESDIAEEIAQFALDTAADREPVRCLQLKDVRQREARLSSILSKRGERNVTSLAEDWRKLLLESLRDSNVTVDTLNERQQRALAEQAEALERITTRRLTALVGRAGTGKTTVLGALLKSKRLADQGILFLAPTGKARVRIVQKTKQTAMTVAQFLYQLGRYDGARQRPLFTGKDPYRKEKTVVIDESSMLTLDDLYAILEALDQAHVERIILVGDPNQLPPIGIGRPFADLVAHLESDASENAPLTGALARLTVELRSTIDRPSDALRLASWYTREPQPVDADRVLSDLELGSQFNDLTIAYWQTPDELRTRVDEQLRTRFSIREDNAIAAFNSSLGLTPEGWVPFKDHSGAEKWQILSPVRLHPHGVHELNRLIQRRFRQQQLSSARKYRGVKLGDEEIVWGDKVILVKNGTRRGWNFDDQAKVSEYLANGEFGVAAKPPKSTDGDFLNVAFAGREGSRFSFDKKDFTGDRQALELAYALTVHKAQGSEFGTVFVVLPRESRLLTRELLYTALTRSREHLVLLIEGKDASLLYDLTRPERSETARRNSNLFAPGVRSEVDGVPYAEHLIHRTTRGELVRSKSELAIAEHLYRLGLKYHYERVLVGNNAIGKLLPDFTFIDDAGDLVIWEHLGMLGDTNYEKSWEWKRSWYSANGFVEGQNLFTTSERNGLDMQSVDMVANRVRTVLGA